MRSSVPKAPATRQDLMVYLKQLKIAITSQEHLPVFTVAESDALERHMPGGHTKNLFLKDAKGQLFLIVAEAHTIVDLKSLHKTLNCKRLSFGNADLLLATLGIAPGSVTAFAVLNDRANQVTVVIDKALMHFDIINCHPLVNSATSAIARDDLLRFLCATGHDPLIVDLTTSSTSLTGG